MKTLLISAFCFLLLSFSASADTLYFNGRVVTTGDAAHIATITRKGGKVIAAPPSYDPSTQKPPVYDGSKWVTPSMSQAELDAVAAAQADATEKAAIKAAISAFKAGTATNAQVQRALAYLLKQLQ
ncbi:MAG: hypothetical protein K8R87_01115 [Verrucomicrobia bacterium]|nr:hypothetical protein [Verrucomicrobiota bacterium]